MSDCEIADEQIDLVALTWLGRGDGNIEVCADLRQSHARPQSAHEVVWRNTSLQKDIGRGSLVVRF
jgi:Protein of unknown function (DUF3775)